MSWVVEAPVRRSRKGVPKFVPQPLLLQPNRSKLNKVCNNAKLTNTLIHQNLMERMIFEQMSQIKSMKPGQKMPEQLEQGKQQVVEMACQTKKKCTLSSKGEARRESASRLFSHSAKKAVSPSKLME